MKFIIFTLLCFSNLMAQDFGMNGVLYGVTTREVPTFQSPDTIRQHTITYVKFKNGNGVHLCPFLNQSSLSNMLSIANAGILSSKEIFISTVRTDYSGRELTKELYGKDMEKCAISISLYKVGS